MTSQLISADPVAAGGEEVAVVLGTRLWLLFVGLATQSLLARILEPEGRGEYAVCMLFAMLFGTFFAPGTDRGAQYFVLSKQISLSAGTWIATIFSLLGSSLAVLIALPLIQSNLSFFQKASPVDFYASLVLLPLILVNVALQMQIAGRRRFARLARFSVVQGVANLVLMGVFVWYLEWNVPGALIASVLTQLLLLALQYCDLRRHCGLVRERLRVQQFVRIAGYGGRYYAARLGSQLSFQMGALLLAFVAPKAEIGIYSVAVALLLRTVVIADSIEASLLPRVAGEPGGRPHLVGQCARLSGFATGCVVLALVLVAEPLIDLLFSSAFQEAARLIWIASPGVVVYSAVQVLMTYFRGVDRPGVCSMSVWLGLAANAGVLLALYGAIGIEAAAWAMSAGFIARSLVLVAAFRRVTGIRHSETWVPRRADFDLVASSGRQIYSRLVERRH